MTDNPNHVAVRLTGNDLDPHDVFRIAEGGVRVELAEGVDERIHDFRDGLVMFLKENPKKPVYGVNRACGALLRGGALKPQQHEAYRRADSW